MFFEATVNHEVISIRNLMISNSCRLEIRTEDFNGLNPF